MNRLSQPGALRIPSVAIVAWAALAAAVGSAEGRPPVSFSQEEPVPVTPTLAPAVTGSAAPFARIRYQEGGVEVGRGRESQAVGVNYPVFAGESIATDSGQRAELQLPDGTLLRIDRDTRVAFDDFSARDGGTSVVALSVGQIQLTISDPRGGDSLRIDTPSASIYPLDPSSLRVDIDPGDMVRVSVSSGRVEVAAETGSVVLVSGERTLTGPGAAPRDPWRYASGSRDDFDAWTAERDAEDPATDVAGNAEAEFEALPEEVQPYYGELSDNGNWVFTEDYGWAFQPNVGSGWQPYQDGQWYPSPSGDPVWVGTEPWGWVTWRYGSWGFNAGLGGWIWIPGAVWRPANVWWFYGPSFVGWVPVGFWGWPAFGCCGSWGNPWFDNCPWTFVGYDRFWGHPVPRAAVPRDRILNPELDRGVVSREAIPAPDGRRARAADRAGREPREPLDRGVYDRARARAERGDRDVRPVPRGSVEDEMRRERADGARAPRGGGGTDPLPLGRRDASDRRSGEKSGGTVKPPAAGAPRAGS
ncbi:MAG: FecR family protein, partial [Acidobacteria bacterium]|nr:FecR family protein [Acidobacteriota bacterium]